MPNQFRRSRARNLNDPQHWLAWLKACQKDEWSSQKLRLPGSLGMLTGSDVRGITAIAHCWPIYVHAAERHGVIVAVRALLSTTVQNKCWGFARELIAQSMDWHDREPVWDRVMDGWIEDTARQLTTLVGGATLAPRSRLYPFDQNVETQGAALRNGSR